MPRIFMSYRRSDSISESGRIHDHLEREFSGRNVFKDVDDIQPGFDFRKVLDEEVAKCDVLLAIIGPDWTTAVDGDGQLRLQNPDDFVRLEVESGLKRGNAVLVIPVLIKNATMPTIAQLPESLHELTYRNAVIIRNDPDFNRDMRRLIDYIHRYTKPKSSVSRNTIIGGVGLLVIAVIIGVLVINTLMNPPLVTPTTLTPSDETTTPTTKANTPQAGDKETAEDLSNQAQDNASNGKYTQAIELYTQAINADPTYANAYLGRALVHVSGFSDFDRAIPDLEQAISLDTMYGEAYRYLGYYQYEMGVYEDVEANLLRAIELNPSDVDARLWLTQYYTDFGAYDMALAQYDKLLDRQDTLDSDTLYSVWIRKADAQEALEEVDNAIESYQTAISINPDRVEAYAALGNIYVYDGDYENALEFLDAAIDIVDDDPTIFYDRGTAFFEYQSYSQSIADFSRALQLDPNYIAAYIGRGQTRTVVGDYVAAIADFNQAITRDNTDSQAHYLRGLALYNSENYESAIEDFTIVIDMNAYTNEAYAYRGLAYEQLGDIDSARSDLQTALDYGLSEDELKYEVLVELGWLDVDDENYEGALQLFTQAISIRPDQALAYEGQADVFSQLAYNAENSSNALTNWISVVDSLTRGIDKVHDPLNLIFQRGIAYKELGLDNDDETQLELAVADFEQVTILDPSIASTYAHLAELALNLDSYTEDDALNYAETAYQLDNSDAYVNWALGAVYEEMGNTQQAIRYYQLAIDNSDEDSGREDYQAELDRLNG